MRFPPEFIERLREHLPISEVIGKRLPLKRHGREFQGLCPFHKEKTPSFTVNDEKGFYHCFGCGAHGDAIGFIKDFDGVNYGEAVERLAGEAGLPVPQMTREAVERERRRHTLEDAMHAAEHWFSEQLALASGAEARNYLSSRQLTEATATRFGLGFAPAQRDALKNALTTQGFPIPLLVEAGLLIALETGEVYDRFRARLMFPIRSGQGKTIAFGGRILPSAHSPNAAKYLNSPETPLFKKGENLYAYDTARLAARDKGTMVVAEGYMDVITLHQAGFTTAVAPLGTAITESQLRLLWRAAHEPILCLDGDEAGARAMMKAAELALPHLKPGFSLKFAVLPKGEDPDSMLRGAGKSSMIQILTQAKILSTVLWEQAQQRFGTETPEKKSEMEHYLMQCADRIGDSLVRQHMRNYFREQLFSAKQWKKKGKLADQVAANTVLSPLPDANDDNTHLRRLEEQIIVIILLCPDILHQADVEEQIGHMDFSHAELDKLRAAILEVSAHTPSLDNAELCSWLNGHGLGEKVETLLQSKHAIMSDSLRCSITQDASAALQAFSHAFASYTLKRLEHEMHVSALALEEQMSERNYEHFLALQKQVEDIRRSRYGADAKE